MVTLPKPHITAKVTAPKADSVDPRAQRLASLGPARLAALRQAKAAPARSPSRHGQKPRAATISRHGKPL